MSKITFVILEHESSNITLDRIGNIGDYCNTHLLKLSDNWIKDTKIYIQGKLITDHSMEFFQIEDFLKSNGIKCRLMFSKLFINLTEQQLNEPMVKYLSENNFARACWMKDNKNINIKNTFNYYSMDNDSQCIGFTSRHQNCEQKNCDLVVYEHSCAGYTTILSRFYDYEIIVYNEPKTTHSQSNSQLIKLQLPVISNKQIIIENFLKSYHDKKLLISDLDLYIVQMKQGPDDQYNDQCHYQDENEDKDKDKDKNKDKDKDKDQDNSILIYYYLSMINNNNDFVLETFSENNRIEYDMGSQHILHNYCVILKNILFRELIFFFPFFPECLSKIIHEYVDFESIKPDPMFLINEDKIRKYLSCDPGYDIFLKKCNNKF